MADIERPIPQMGDNRYTKFRSKEAGWLDVLRIIHYEMFGKDLSISGETFEYIRGVNEHKTLGHNISAKGIEKFLIGFAHNYSNYLAFTCKLNIFNKENAVEFTNYMNQCFRRLVNNEYNLVFRYLDKFESGNYDIGIDYVPFAYYHSNHHEIYFNNVYSLLKDWLDHTLIDLIYIDKNKLLKSGLKDDHFNQIMELIEKLEKKSLILREQYPCDCSRLKKVLKIN